MRYLIYMAAVLTVSFPLVVFGGETRSPATEQEVLERMAGTWVEDRAITLEQIYRRLAEEGLSEQERGQLYFLRNTLQKAELELSFGEDGAARISGSSGQNEVDERGRVKVLAVDEDRATISFEGGEVILNRELTVGFDVEEGHGFYLLMDNKIKRYFLPK